MTTSFSNKDVFSTIASNLTSADVCHWGLACKSLAEAADQPVIWWQHFVKEKIPFVDRKDSDYKKEFKILQPITLSGRIIEQFFGEIVGEIPKISLEWFNSLSRPESYDKKEIMAKSWALILEPPAIKRKFAKHLSATLDANGNLKIFPRMKKDLATATETQLVIPFTLSNFRILCCYPLSGGENKPVFDWGLSGDAPFQFCAPPTTKVIPHLMRKLSPSEMFFKHAPDQKKEIESKGFKTTTTRVRAFYNAVQILKDKTCLDSAKPLSFVRTFDHTKLQPEISTPFVIGRYEPQKGLQILEKSDASSYVGAIPSISVEAKTEEEQNKIDF
jgi:hypothetical protein